MEAKSHTTTALKNDSLLCQAGTLGMAISEVKFRRKEYKKDVLTNVLLDFKFEWFSERLMQGVYSGVEN